MRYSEDFYQTKDGRKHFYRMWIPDKTEAVLVCLHGIGTSSWRFLEMGEYMAMRRIKVFAPDLRSYGCNQGTRAYVKSFMEFVDDWEVFRREVLLKEDIKENYLLGDSLGGLISIYIALHRPEGLTKLILTSPALRRKVKVDNFTLFLAQIALFVAPKAHFAVPIYPEDILYDENYTRKCRLSSLETPFITPATFNALNKCMEEVWRRAGEIKTPMIILQAEKDTIVAPEAPAEFASRAPGCQVKVLPGERHAFINDLNKEKIYDLIWEQIKA